MSLMKLGSTGYLHSHREVISKIWWEEKVCLFLSKSWLACYKYLLHQQNFETETKDHEMHVWYMHSQIMA